MGVLLSKSSLDSLVMVKKAVAATGRDDTKFSVPGASILSGSSVTNLEKCWCAATVTVANFEEFPMSSV